MKQRHIKFHVPPPKHSKAQRLDYMRNSVYDWCMKSIENAINTNLENFNFLLYLLFKDYRVLLKNSLNIYELTGEKSDWESVLYNLHTGFSALEALILNQTAEITVAGVTGRLDPNYPPPKYSGWSLQLFESVSMRRDDLVATLLEYSPETAAEREPEFADLARFHVNYMKGMLDSQGEHERLFTQLNEVFYKDLQYHAQARLKPFYYIAVGDEEGFEQAIFSASEAHRNALNTNGVPIEPTQLNFPSAIIAAASLGYDRYGWTLKHKNDYLPDWWIYNRFASV